MKNERKFKLIFCDLIDFQEKSGIAGLCYFLSAVMFVFCRKLGIESKLCIGECVVDGLPFDHGWIEIDEQPFDIAIMQPINIDYARFPVYNGIDLCFGRETDVIYGIYIQGLCEEAKAVKSRNIFEYLKSAPNNMGMKLILSLSKKYNLGMTEEWLELEFSSVYREYIWHLK